MANAFRLLCVLAHPKDESLATGGMLAKYAAEGIGTYLLTATRGEQGWYGDPHEHPGPAALERLRELELRAAARVLGLRGVKCLNYGEGALAEADSSAVIRSIVKHLRQIQPHVVVTFGPAGLTGHPDHIAIAQYTTAATVHAADMEYREAWDWAPHRVAKLYYLAGSRAQLEAYAALFGTPAITIDGVPRYVPGWPEWAITTRIDTLAYWQQVWQAISCYRSQLPAFGELTWLPEEQYQLLWGVQTFYRVFSLVNQRRAVEDDLFAGLR